MAFIQIMSGVVPPRFVRYVSQVDVNIFALSGRIAGPIVLKETLYRAYCGTLENARFTSTIHCQAIYLTMPVLYRQTIPLCQGVPSLDRLNQPRSTDSVRYQ